MPTYRLLPSGKRNANSSTRFLCTWQHAKPRNCKEYNDFRRRLNRRSPLPQPLATRPLACWFGGHSARENADFYPAVSHHSPGGSSSRRISAFHPTSRPWSLYHMRLKCQSGYFCLLEKLWRKSKGACDDAAFVGKRYRLPLLSM
jgi:hypothetical protein